MAGRQTLKNLIALFHVNSALIAVISEDDLGSGDFDSQLSCGLTHSFTLFFN